MQNQEKRKKIILGMSGGIDSSVAAILLREQGFEVRGVFLRLWKEKGLSDKDSLRDVKRVANKLRIDLKIIDVQKEFKKEVVGYFLNEYSSGRTPNPCVFCNKKFKLKVLFEEMKKQKADWVATGHYARIRGKKPRFNLWQGFDEIKDQSYFLYTLNQKELSKLIFPLGELKKIEVKKIAQKFGLDFLEKKESQDICFLKKNNTRKFLEANIFSKKGKIINEKGEEIGEHQGLSFYTIGQRKGINIGGVGPYFVVAKDFNNNFLLVSNEKVATNFLKRKIEIEKVHWILEKPKFPYQALIRIRYQQKPISAIISEDSAGGTNIVFEKLQSGIASGQSAVFFSSQGEVLGGGIIKD